MKKQKYKTKVYIVKHDREIKTHEVYWYDSNMNEIIFTDVLTGYGYYKTYDRKNRLLSFKDSEGVWMENIYKDNSKVTKDSNGNILEYLYDARGNIIQFDNNKGLSYTSLFSEKNVEIVRRYKDNSKIIKQVNDEGKVITITNTKFNNDITEISYNDKGYISKIENHLTKSIEWFEYKSKNKISKITTNNSKDATYYRYRNGNLSSVVCGDYIKEFKYDIQDRVKYTRELHSNIEEYYEYY